MRSDPTIESSPSDYKVVSDVIKNREDVESKSASSPNFIGEKIFGLDRTQLLKSLWSKKKSKQLKGSGEPQHDS